MVSRCLKTLGDRLGVAYDIGCKFQGTIESTTLGKPFTEGGSHCFVNAYHGYAHNFAYQIVNHPNNIVGVGIDDLEVLERFFSLSNATASAICHASPYLRRLMLDLFLHQNNRDKYANLGIWIRNNYVQSVEIINDGSVTLRAFLDSLQITEADLD